MMAAIPDAIRPRLGQFVRLLGSDQPGEVVAAASALKRALAGCGADLNDLGNEIEHPPTPLVVYRDHPVAAPRRSRKTQTSSARTVQLEPARRRQVVDALSKAIDRGALSGWEEEFSASVITILRSTRPRLSERQFEIVERILSKVGGYTA